MTSELTGNNLPYLTSEQRVSRLFEINAVHHTEQTLLFALNQEQLETDAARNALVLIRTWAVEQRGKIDARYRALAVANMLKRQVTTWQK